MAVIARPSVEDETFDYERAVLAEVIAAIREGREPQKICGRGIPHLCQAFERAQTRQYVTETRTRVFKWLGEEEGVRIVALLHDFFQSYWAECLMRRRIMPFMFVFESHEQQVAINAALQKLLDTMIAHREGFPIWPFPSTGF